MTLTDDENCVTLHSPHSGNKHGDTCVVSWDYFTWRNVNVDLKLSNTFVHIFFDGVVTESLRAIVPSKQLDTKTGKEEQEEKKQNQGKND